ncbi:hypothetical protein [Streptomyces gardneri]|uniref:hypothetical protein n=1 Tax=Streptomyces gardneri TaxID=66892 RepID=UPI0035D7BE6C
MALEGISHVVGAYSRLIAQAEEAGDAGRAAEQSAWAARRKSLTPQNRAEVDVVTGESAQMLTQLRSAR